MLFSLPEKDLEDGKKIATMFDNFSEQNKKRAIIYMTILKEKASKEVCDDRSNFKNLEISIDIAELLEKSKTSSAIHTKKYD